MIVCSENRLTNEVTDQADHERKEPVGEMVSNFLWIIAVKEFEHGFLEVEELMCIETRHMVPVFTMVLRGLD